MAYVLILPPCPKHEFESEQINKAYRLHVDLPSDSQEKFEADLAQFAAELNNSECSGLIITAAYVPSWELCQKVRSWIDEWLAKQLQHA